MRKQKPIDLVDEASVKYLDRSILRILLSRIRPQQTLYETMYNQMRDNQECSIKPLFIKWKK